MPESKFDTRELLLDFVSAEKREQILLAFARLNEDLGGLRANTSPEKRLGAYKNLERQADQRIKELLTPEEALQYDLRFSRTANAMRASLGGFDPTESEFIEIFKIRKPFAEAENAEIEERGGVPMEKVQANKDAVDQQIKNLLGESRFADYERTGDYGFQQLWKLTQKSGQSTSVAISAFETQRAAMGKAYELRQSNLHREQLYSALDSLRAATEAALESTLGPEAWPEYTNSIAMTSLRDISQRR
jgi:hypothetical protein